MQLKDTQAKLVLCVPEFSSLVERAVGLLDPTTTIRALCFGETPWCENAFDLLDGVDPADCPEPYTTNDTKGETVVIFWTSGTTGERMNHTVSASRTAVPTVVILMHYYHRAPEGHLSLPLHLPELWRHPGQHPGAGRAHRHHHLLLPRRRVLHRDILGHLPPVLLPHVRHRVQARAPLQHYRGEEA